MKRKFVNPRHSLNMVFVIWTFLVLGCVCSNNKPTETPKTNSTEVITQVTPSPIISTTPIPTPTSTPLDENSPDYKTGYAKGLHSGKELTKAKIPSNNIEPQMVQSMARFQAEDLKPQPKDFESFQAGFEQGFNDGFKSQGISPNLQRLSWDNAKVGVKLYESNGKQAATILIVDESAGMITVKYTKERGGVVENKYLEPLSKLWFVRNYYQ